MTDLEQRKEQIKADLEFLGRVIGTGCGANALQNAGLKTLPEAIDV